MKLKAKIIAAAVCAMALCVALAGCAGGGTNSGNDATNFQMGLNVYMQLNEGGNAVISLFGENVDGTWEAKDATTVAITFQGDTTDAKLEGDELVLSVEGNSLRFKKGDIPPAASEVQRDENQQAEPEA